MESVELGRFRGELVRHIPLYLYWVHNDLEATPDPQFSFVRSTLHSQEGGLLVLDIAISALPK